jgi:sugar fermentation stimulation protein A
MKKAIFDLPFDAQGIFRERPNRFLGIVDITEPKILKNVEVHIHDPGRLKEILYPGNRVLLKKALNKNRKTAWDMISGKVEKYNVLIHSGYHRNISENILKDKELCPFGELRRIRPEVKAGESRLDYLVESRSGRKIWIEIKGCSLCIDGVALFPDAPTSRGKKHLETLIQLKRDGAEAAVIFLVFGPDSKYFTPNKKTDPAFAATLKRALKCGIEVHPLLFQYDNGKIYYKGKIPVKV